MYIFASLEKSIFQQKGYWSQVKFTHFLFITGSTATLILNQVEARKRWWENIEMCFKCYTEGLKDV